MVEGWLSEARREFHASVLDGILTRTEEGVPSNADKSSQVSVAIADRILNRIGAAKTSAKLAGQTAGANFEQVCATFVEVCFERLTHLRPGQFTVKKGGDISEYDQYSHLDELASIAKSNKEFATALGSDYLISPDIVVIREPETDSVINSPIHLVDEHTARLTSLRIANSVQPILHASLSCKWTLRSDRAQNARSEALNLVRNRKGRLPHIAAITAEPTPGRIASLALGTGDIDCVYHFALYELRSALVELGREDALDLLDTMVEGKRLRDISDLPLDLVV